MAITPDILVKPVRHALVLDGNALQRCPDCGACEGLRMCGIRPHAVVWCACGRAWPYPTLTFQWLVDNIDRMYSDPSDGPRIEWDPGEPIPDEVLERAPGLDVLVGTIDAVVAAGYVDSHRRLTDTELDGLLAGTAPANVDRLPTAGMVAVAGDWPDRA